MKKVRVYLFALLIVSGFLFPELSFGQERDSKVDLRFGTGLSILGSGDMITCNFENEVNYKLNRFLSASLSLNVGRSNMGVYETASFTQGNINAYFSPLGNNRRNDFRIGAGFTYYAISDAYMESAEYQGDELVDIDYVFRNRNSHGLNIVVENTFALSSRFLIGVKLFTQPYSNGDINSGILLKFGVKI